MHFALPSATLQTRQAALACIARLEAMEDALAATPARALEGMVAALRGAPSLAEQAWIVRADAPSSAAASAWPLWFQPRETRHERPLFYLMHARSIDELRALALETGERGIFGNSVDAPASARPGMQPGLPLWLAANPRCTPYDPASAQEARAIVTAALRRLYVDGRQGFYYLRLHDRCPDARAEGPDLSRQAALEAARGMYLVRPASARAGAARVRLLGAGQALDAVLAAGRALREEWNVETEVWSCPSYTRLARESRAVERWNRLHPCAPRRRSHLQRCLGTAADPVIAVTGYDRCIAEQIGRHAPGRFLALGAESAGRAGTPVDARWIAFAALGALVDEGRLPSRVAREALLRYGFGDA
ncbi:pyruvate dehydrogenase [Pseudomonas sp. RIT-PI-AD]|uniref:transketolase-like TK C-terminal-containing protein n=1 Tax=Pseudomonas sp. RIT-PI-AD TaxID=3035294 RepID=UPI0021D9DAC0|nr:pyruvate dehydrogenase [Pseudomonas sp. RIT-PI-AD]